MTVIIVFLFLLLAAAVIMDLQSDRIPNWLVLLGFLVGIWTTDHIFKSIFTGLFIILIFFPLFCIKALGAGDIKCMAMISFYLTFSQWIIAICYAFFLAAVYAVCRIFYYHSFSERKQKIHLALPILGGVLISVGGTYL